MVLTLESTQEQIEKRVKELSKFGYSYPEVLAELEIIEKTALIETGLTSFEDIESKLSSKVIRMIFEKTEVENTCWQDGNEKMVYFLAEHNRGEVLEKLLSAREWTPLGQDYLSEIKRLINNRNQVN